MLSVVGSADRVLGRRQDLPAVRQLVDDEALAAAARPRQEPDLDGVAVDDGGPEGREAAMSVPSEGLDQAAGSVAQLHPVSGGDLE